MPVNNLNWRLEGLNIAHLILDDKQCQSYSAHLGQHELGETLRALLTAWSLVHRRPATLAELVNPLNHNDGVKQLVLSASLEPTDRNDSRQQKWLTSWYKDVWSKKARHHNVTGTLELYLRKHAKQGASPVQYLQPGSSERRAAIQRVGWNSDPAEASTTQRPKLQHINPGRQTFEDFAEALSNEIDEATTAGDQVTADILQKVHDAIPEKARG